MENKKEFYFKMPYDPSPEEIRRACEEIQKGWTPTEKKARIVSNQYDSENLIPLIHVMDDNFIRDSFYRHINF